MLALESDELTPSNSTVGDCSPLAPCLNISCNKKSKNVRFESVEQDPEDDATETGAQPVLLRFAPTRPALSSEEIADMCWTNRNFKEFKLEAKKFAHSIDEDKNGDYIRIFLNVYSSPPKDEQDIGYVSTRDYSALPLAVAPTRGLERFVFPGILQDQKRTKESVLKAQASLPREMEQSAKETILASTSQILSRQSRRVARVLGHADSIAALSIYKRTFQGKKK